MSGISEPLRAQVARAQRSTPVRAGDVFVRGARLTWVISADGDEVAWHPAGGALETGTLTEFRSQALRRVPVEPAHADALDNAWQIARAKTIPAETRVRVLGRAWQRRRGNESYAQRVKTWIATLAAGGEPVFGGDDE